MTRALARLRARLDRRGDDTGSISLFVAVAIVSILLVIGLVVDGGGKLRALDHAQAAAQEAARTGANAVNTGQAISGDGITIDRNQAQAAATAYLAQAGVTGTVNWGSDGSIIIDVTETYRPLFLTGDTTVTGHASAKLIVQGG